MNVKIPIAGVIGAALFLSLVQPLVLAEAPDANDPHPGMEIDNDVVSEWENPKLTELERLPDLARMAEKAEESPILIFKHSTTCPISGRAAQRMDTLLNESESELPDLYMVKVIESRPVSNAIEDQYEVKHESPQILLIKDGEAVWNTSHDDITAANVLKALGEHELIPKQPQNEESADAN